jgi:hypothetical protein
MKKVRKLYSSSNGDRWYLIGEPAGGAFVRHEANLASGGHVTHLEIGDFLSTEQAFVSMTGAKKTQTIFDVSSLARLRHQFLGARANLCPEVGL